jgi:REP element-mobilizing transposase RayT
VATGVVRILREGVTDGRFDLAAYVLMPNHIHLLLKPEDTLPRQIAWIKGRTAFEANRVLKRSGSFWAKDYFDRWIRNRNECEKVIRYVERNPVKAGLCKSPEDWEWSSARQRDFSCVSSYFPDTTPAGSGDATSSIGDRKRQSVRRMLSRFRLGSKGQTQQILNEVTLLVSRKAEVHAVIIVIYDVSKCREAAIVIEAAFHVCE